MSSIWNLETYGIGATVISCIVCIIAACRLVPQLLLGSSTQGVTLPLAVPVYVGESAREATLNACKKIPTLIPGVEIDPYGKVLRLGCVEVVVLDFTVFVIVRLRGSTAAACPPPPGVGGTESTYAHEQFTTQPSEFQSVGRRIGGIHGLR